MENIKLRHPKPRVEDLSVDELVKVVKLAGLDEFEEILREKGLNGEKIVNITEGILKLWRPKLNAKKLIEFVDDLKYNFSNYIHDIRRKAFTCEVSKNKKVVNVKRNETVTYDCNGKRMSTIKLREENVTTLLNSEDIFFKLVPPDSFLYRKERNKKVKSLGSYCPMDLATIPLKYRNKTNSYEYTNLDLASLQKRSSEAQTDFFNDRGYYAIKNQLNNEQEDIYRIPAPRINTKPQLDGEEFLELNNDKLWIEDHYYEDLSYSDVKCDVNKDNRRGSIRSSQSPGLRLPYLGKIHQLFQSFRIRNIFKHNDKDQKIITNANNVDLNEERTSDAGIYDSVLFDVDLDNKNTAKANQEPQAKPEEYLEPIQRCQDYCDVEEKEKEENLVAVIMRVFESKFGSRKESNDTTRRDAGDEDEGTDIKEATVKWEQTTWKSSRVGHKMAARPLPVPMENEGYYMQVDRAEAVRLLEKHPDGNFLLRPSSQPNHAYTLSVSCSGTVHNVGIRRREDGRLALGYARRGERCFPTVPSLLEYHRKKKLVLVAGGTSLGSTVLKESPLYYQVPSNVPVVLNA